MADKKLSPCYLRGFFFLLLCFQTVNGDTLASDWQFFYNKIFADYNKLSFPKNNQSDQLSVSISMKLDNIQEFSDRDGTITLVGNFIISWKSEILAWTEKPVGVTDVITTAKIPRSDLWYPPIYTYNGVDQLSVVGTNNDLIDVRFDGTHVWKPAFIIKAGCDVNIELFPFDSQTCSFDMSHLDYSPEELALSTDSTSLDTTDFVQNIIWDMNTTTVSTSSTSKATYVSFNIHLKRRSTYFVIVLAAPILLLGIINGFAFLMPIDHGRVGFSMTVYLTFSVFLTIIGDNLPRTSNPLSTLSLYIVILMAFSGVITIVSIFTVRQHLKTIDLKVPSVVSFIVGTMCCMVCRCKREKKAKIHPDGISISSYDFEDKRRKFDVYYLPQEHKFGVSNVKWDKWKKREEIEEPPPYTKKVTCSERCWFCRVPEEMTWVTVSRAFDYLLFLATIAVHSYLAYVFLNPMLKEGGYV
ncbi:CHRNA9 [Mytilus coruscus]|uniref:CHRNA9 n=1 Tax=Mytilus coruscus TaxID=42192 RepID=A0A6J8EAR0_MYTCO|nr:CHRNA9 [Mytilus coruscus]